MMFQRSCLSLLSLLCVLYVNAQVKLIVSLNGNDKNTGTLQSPFHSLERALSYANQFPGEHVSILLRGGTYYLDKTIELNAGSILPGSLQIGAYNGETVKISAGRRLQLHWKPYKNGIYQAIIPNEISFERLYINGLLQVLARYPNYDSAARIFHGTAVDAIARERVKRWSNPAGGYVHALHAGEWGGFHYRITGTDARGNLQLDGGWQNNRPAAMHTEFRFVENIFEELDAPGEWWLDRGKHILYYYPSKQIVHANLASGIIDPLAALASALVEVSHLENSIELHGTLTKPLTNIALTQLEFVHNERSFMDTKEPLLRSDWTIYRGGAVLLDGTENCRVSDCHFTGLGGNAVMLSNYNRHDTITGCLIEHIGANAVCFVGDPKAVRSPSFKYEAFVPYDQMDKTPGPLTNNYPQDCLVANNLLHDLGDIEKQATGVEIEMSSSITVSHNSIYNTPRAGINIGDGCWGGHILEYNDVFNTVLETGDHGAFNSWGRDRYWSADRHYMDSLVQVHPELILLDAVKQNTIHDNRFRCDHGWDIDLDDGSTNYHIYNNVCLNGGLKLREGFYRIVENNIMINNSFHPHVWFKNSGDIFAHNIVMKPYAPIGISFWGKKVDDNLFPDTAALLEARQLGTDARSHAGFPLFISAAGSDYRVAGNSPAFAIGFHNFPTDGVFGVQKPVLRRMAATPAIPALIVNGLIVDEDLPGPFLGGIIKSVEGLGERSAYGLPEASGVIIISAGQNNLLSGSGLLDKDVIIKVDGQPVKDVQTMLDIYQTSSGKKDKIALDIYRNQQPMRIVLQLK